MQLHWRLVESRVHRQWDRGARRTDQWIESERKSGAGAWFRKAGVKKDPGL